MMMLRDVRCVLLIGGVLPTLLPAALMILMPAVVQAQTGTVAGVVSDPSGLPLPGVNVVIANTTVGAASEVDGSFHIANVPVGTQMVVASAVGYERAEKSVAVRAGEVSAIDFVLREIAVQSGEVIVTASRLERLTGGVAASVSTITPREIQARNAVALDDALRHVSGIQIAGNQLNIRGSSGFSFNTGSRVLLLIDGSPMLRPDVNGVPYDAIPMSQVRRIEVLKGPGSALYGGGALGGVINVITRDIPDAAETFISAFGGAYQPVRYEEWRSKWDDATVPQPLAGITAAHARPLGGQVGMWAHVSYRYDAGHLRLDSRENLQAYGKVTWKPEADTRLSILSGVTRRTSDNFLFWNGLTDPLNPGQLDFGQEANSTGSDDNLINELVLLPTYSDVVTEDLLLTARGRLFGVLIQPLDDAGNPKPLAQGTVGFRYGGEIQGDYAPTSDRTISVGITGDANAARSSYFEDDDRLRQPEGGAFVQWEESSLDRLTLAAGARYDVYKLRGGVVESKVSPKLNASYRLSERFILRGAFGEGFRVPSVLERYVSSTDYLPLISNLDLLPETSRSYEVGLRSYPRLGELSTTVDAAAFWSDYRRLIEPKFIASERAFQFINVTRARIRGLEVTSTLTGRRERSSIQIGYTYLDARDLTEDRALVYRSSHLLKLSGSALIRGIRLGADFRYASKPERVDSDFAIFVKDAELMVPIRVLDLRAGLVWRGIETTLHVKNALDYYYVERPAVLAPPRHFIVQIATRF